MTIDEYLNRLRVLKRKADAAEERCNKIYDKVINPPSASSFDGSPKGRGNVNSNEIRLVKYSDAVRDYKEAYQEYKDHSDHIYSNICNCLYLDGLLLVTAYINNVVFDNDTLHGIGSILNTSDQRVVRNRLHEAKEHLRQVLIQQGMDIE